MNKDNLPAVRERTPLYITARLLFGALFRTIVPIHYHDTAPVAAMKPPYILIGNHLSFADPMVLAGPIKDYEIRFVGKRELAGRFTKRLLEGLHMIPVSRHATDMAAMRACVGALKEGHILGIFPEGTRHQPELMHEVETGVALIALRTRVPVVPVYIDGRVRPFHRTHVYFGTPMVLDDLMAQGVNADTVAQMCTRIRTTYHGMRDGAQKAK